MPNVRKRGACIERPVAAALGALVALGIGCGGPAPSAELEADGQTAPAQGSGGAAGDGGAPAGGGGGAAGEGGGAAGDGGAAGGGGGAPTETAPPCGIHTLSSPVGSGANLRYVGERDEPFVAGFVLRTHWDQVEREAGVFDFHAIDDVLQRLEVLDQKLTLQITGTEPDHVLAEADSTWTWHDPNPRHTGDCVDADGCERALPWDQPSFVRVSAMARALADHKVPHNGGLVRFADHPSLDQILLPLVGWGRIREIGFQVEDWAGYTRARLTDATKANVVMQYGHFPNVKHQIQIFPVQDDDRSNPLWKELLSAVITSAGSGPKPVFFLENMAHSLTAKGDAYAPPPDPGRAGEPLMVARAQGAELGFQMLTSWDRPFPGQETQVDGGSPVAAMLWGVQTYGARYFEVYARDVDAALKGTQPWLQGFQSLGPTLCPAP